VHPFQDRQDKVDLVNSDIGRPAPRHRELDYRAMDVYISGGSDPTGQYGRPSLWPLANHHKRSSRGNRLSPLSQKAPKVVHHFIFIACAAIDSGATRRYADGDIVGENITITQVELHHRSRLIPDFSV
jgi:hypothetical protein